MHNKYTFATPQLQSPLGIFFIFGASLYKFTRAFWVLGAYLLLKQKLPISNLYLILGLLLAGTSLALFSYRSYQKFRFYINYESGEFILEEGVFKSTETVISFDKIQQVYFKRGILQRIIDVYEVVIDTAGSQKQEVTIKALSRNKAEALQAILMQAAHTQKEHTAESDESEGISEQLKNPEKEPVAWSFKLSKATLLKLGLSGNYLKGVWVLLFFLFSLVEQFDRYPGEETISRSYNQFIDQEHWYQWFFFGLISLFVAGVIVTTIEIFFKYYNLQLKYNGNELQVQMGLRTQTQIAVKARRVQIFSIKANRIQQRLNLYTARVALADSRETSEKSTINIPGLPYAHVRYLKDILLDVPSDSESASRSYKPNVLVFYRKCILYLVPVPFMIGLVSFIPPYVDIRFWWVMLTVYSLLVVIFQWFAYKALHIQFTDELFIKRSGLWTRKSEFIPLSKIQSVSCSQPFWYKKRALYNIKLHTASGDKNLPAMNEEVLSELNYCLYKAEISLKAWM